MTRSLNTSKIKNALDIIELSMPINMLGLTTMPWMKV
jgi:hypothetical protein